MGIWQVAGKVKDFVANGPFTKLLGALLGGHLGHKVVIVLGMGFFAYGAWRAFEFVLICVVGMILAGLATWDFERISKEQSTS